MKYLPIIQTIALIVIAIGIDRISDILGNILFKLQYPKIEQDKPLKDLQFFLRKGEKKE